MAATAYVDDVLSLIAALRESDRARGVLAEIRAADGGAPEVEIEAYVKADGLRPALAVQQAIQLSVDAAAVFVDTYPDRGFENISRDQVEAFLGDRTFELGLVEFRIDSFFGRYSINPKKKNGRARLYAVAVVAATALTLTGVLAPGALIIVTGVASMDVALTPDDVPSESVDLKTIDPADADDSPPRITVRGSEGADGDLLRTPGANRGYVYDIHLDGPAAAIEAFADKVFGWREVDSWELALFAGAGERSRIRFWSQRSIGPRRLSKLATAAGVTIYRIVKRSA